MLGYFATAGLAILTLALYGKMILNYFSDRREQRKFDEFEDVISGKNNDPVKAEKYFSGEVKVTQRVQIFIPKAIPSEERAHRFEQPIASELQQSGLGELIRGFTMDDSSGFDVDLNDFVNGVELLRNALIRLEAPAGTLIEYSHGDLPIYEI